MELCLELASKSTVDYSWVCHADKEPEFDPEWIRNRFADEDKSKMSNLGRFLFLEEENLARNVTRGAFSVFWWSPPGEKPRKLDPIGRGCSVQNCRVAR
jgi:hypothetical protein